MNPFSKAVSSVKKVFSNAASAAKGDLSTSNEVRKLYSPGVSAGYLSSGGTGNFAGTINTELKKRNMPGQVLTGAISNARTSSPQYKTNMKLSQGGQRITPTQQRQTTQEAIKPVLATFGGTVSKPHRLDLMAKAAPKQVSVPKIDKYTQQEMVNFIDYVRLKQPTNLQAEFEATRLAEHYGLSLPKTRSGLANVFDKVLQKQKR